MSSTTKIIIDCDPGIDDAYTLLLAMRAAEKLDDFSFLGVTTVAGNVSVEMTTRNALSLLEACESTIAAPPVYAGAARGFVEETHFCPQIHGDDGVGDIGLADPTTLSAERDCSAVEYLLRASREHAGEITLIAIGPLTNVGLAVRADPQFAKRIKSIVLMGGAVRSGGNATRWAEANIFDDPEAAEVVLSSGAHVVMYPWDVFSDFNFDFDAIAEFEASAVPAAKLAGRLMRSEANRFKMKTAALGDAGTLAYVLLLLQEDADAVTLEHLNVVVELHGSKTRGMTVADLRPVRFEPDTRKLPPNVYVITKIDAEKFRRLYRQFLLQE